MISKRLDQISKGILLVALAGMLGLSSLGILLRWMGLSLLWIDPVVRHLVLVAAFGGGVLAVGKNSHIKIDVLAKPMEHLPLEYKRMIERILSLVTMLATSGLVWSAWQFYLSEKEFGGEALLGLHSSTLVMIFPIGWALLTVRWFLSFIDSFKKAY